jgi:hypothetical protein
MEFVLVGGPPVYGIIYFSTVDSGGAGGARAPPEFRGSERGKA